MVSALAWLVALVLAHCGPPPGQRCKLEPQGIVAASPGLGFDAIAVATGARGALFVWSEPSGLWARRERSTPVRVGERCGGGLDVQVDGERELVACSGAGAPESDVVVYGLASELTARSRTTVGRAGRDGRGVALALHAGAAYVLYHDGSIGEHAVWLARLGAGEATRRRLSPSGVAAGEPALFAHGGHLYAAFSTLELALGREVESTIWLARDLGPAVRVARARVAAPAPTLSADARGLMLGFRDRARLARGDPERNELYVARVTPEGALLGRARAIGRANSDGEPSLHGCGGLTAALLPRDYGGERFVGINALDGELSSLGPGHQFYASERDFVLAEAACAERGWTLVTASRAAPGRPGVEAVALRFSCSE